MRRALSSVSASLATFALRSRSANQSHAGLIGGVFMFVALVIAALVFTALALPKSYIGAATAAVFTAFALFFAWARTPLLRSKSATQTGAPTIREHIKRTRAYFQRILVPAVVLWCVGLTFYKAGLTKLQQQGLAGAGGLVLLWIVWLFVRNRFRCPRCGTDFRQERIAKLGRWSTDPRGAEDLWDSCPHCGVSFTSHTTRSVNSESRRPL
jgi:uncharacterized C2H2 Zn-finger protein